MASTSKKAAAAQKFVPYACADSQRRTCFVVDQSESEVLYIPMDSEGLDVVKTSVEKFQKIYKPIPNYPVEKAAKLYTSYAANLGASQSAIDFLRKFTHMTEKEIHMATTKKTAAEEAKTSKTTKATAKAAPAKTATKTTAKAAPAKTTAKAAPAKTTAKAASSKEPAAKRERGETAAKMFQELIMEGKLTDQQIFDKVAAKFNLDDSKRGYVNWYRNYLSKQGKNPPAAKQGK